jgi:hypothetical protein
VDFISSCAARVGSENTVHLLSTSTGVGKSTVSHRVEPTLEPEARSRTDHPGQGEDEVAVMAEEVAIQRTFLNRYRFLQFALVDVGYVRRVA